MEDKSVEYTGSATVVGLFNYVCEKYSSRIAVNYSLNNEVISKKYSELK